MLTKVDNVSITLVSHFLSSKGHVRIFIGRKFWDWRKWKLTRLEFNQFLVDTQITPYKFLVDSKIYWLYQGKFYRDNEGLTSEDVKALLITRQKLQRSRIDRAKTIAASPTSHTNTTNTKPSRASIPDDVKLLVWQRDRGRCVKCGSNVELQYDHIIPLSLGGASSPQNLQILCGKCNRAKSNSVV